MTDLADATTPDASRSPSTSDDLGRRIDALAEIVTASRGRLPDEVLQPATELTERVADRLRLSGEHTIVALAGATGSGKSSLFNALTDMELAGTGVRRPTTSWALACSWGPEGAEQLLEWMGIPVRHQVSRMHMLDAGGAETNLRGLILLDLPDHDSTEVAHHLEMDRLVRHSDMLVWVLDPQKYADAAIHERYIRPMAGFSDVTLVVLNQIDKIPYEQRDQAMADVRRLIVEDGLTDVEVMAVSATRGDGITELKRELTARIDDKSAARARLVTDVQAAAEVVADLGGTAKTPTLAPETREQLVDELAESAGVPQLVEAIATSARRRAGRFTDWPPIRWVGRLRRGNDDELGLGEDYTSAAVARAVVPEVGPVQRSATELVVRRAVDTVGDPLARPWRSAVRSAAGTDGSVADSLDAAIRDTDITASGTPVWWRAVLVVQWLLLLFAAAGLLLLGVQMIDRQVDLAFSVPDPGDIAGLPFAATLGFGALVAGMVLGLVSRFVTRLSARRHARRVEEALQASISRVADEQVLAPVQAELARYAAYHAGVHTALAPSEV
ncbi:GTPase family protein [Aeromicrobium sp. CF3.5]|uniref:GTPase family protein n=1 Tax=Aeromicrobium sp. CF3.5 TaxID=3373078 RepID=UPI003EE5FC27